MLYKKNNSSQNIAYSFTKYCFATISEAKFFRQVINFIRFSTDYMFMGVQCSVIPSDTVTRQVPSAEMIKMKTKNISKLSFYNFFLVRLDEPRCVAPASLGPKFFIF